MAISQSGRPASEIIAPCTRGNRVVIDNVLVVIEPGDPLGSEALQLLQQMQAEALKRYADAISDSPPPSNELLVPRSAFLLTRLNVQAVGCAALRPLTVEIAEVKRMYVAQSVRRRGIGRPGLQELWCSDGLSNLRWAARPPGHRRT